MCVLSFTFFANENWNTIGIVNPHIGSPATDLQIRYTEKHEKRARSENRRNTPALRSNRYYQNDKKMNRKRKGKIPVPSWIRRFARKELISPTGYQDFLLTGRALYTVGIPGGEKEYNCCQLWHQKPSLSIFTCTMPQWAMPVGNFTRANSTLVSSFKRTYFNWTELDWPLFLHRNLWIFKHFT